MDYIGTLNEKGALSFSKKIETLAKKYSSDNSIYYSIIPSKSYFINDNLKYPFDYNKMFEILNSNILSAEYIDITNALSLDDYYITDPHWKQESLFDVVSIFGENLGFDIAPSLYTENFAEDFKGQHGYNKENFEAEKLVYLTNENIDNATVFHVEGTSFDKIYDTQKLTSSSPYDLFLSGPSAITKITNENSKTDKELVIFRDSYACSLAPLFVENYREITLIDLRYVMSTLLENYVDFKDKDILFIYNDRVVNNGEMLKVITE